MTVSSVKTGYDGISLLVGNAAYDPAATFLIQRTSLAGNTSITFSSIPQNYKHLQLRLLGTDGASNTIFLTFNGDTTIGNHKNHTISANGSTVVAATALAYIQIAGQYYGGSSNASYLSAVISDIHNYASTTQNKTVRSFSGYDANGSGVVELDSGVWLSTAAITSIKVEIGGTFSTGSTVALYGMVG
jgi:hypothetical protein